MHASGVTSSEVGVSIVRVCFDLLVAKGQGGVSERFDAFARSLRDRNAAFGGEEGVMRIISGVEEVLTIKLAKDERHEDVTRCNGTLRIGFLDGFEASESTVIVEVVEVLVGLVDLRREIDRIGVVGGVVGLRIGRSSQQEREKKAECFDALFYGSSPRPGT